jgi:hypothetical protein
MLGESNRSELLVVDSNECCLRDRVGYKRFGYEEGTLVIRVEDK